MLFGIFGLIFNRLNFSIYILLMMINNIVVVTHSDCDSTSINYIVCIRNDVVIPIFKIPLNIGKSTIGGIFIDRGKMIIFDHKKRKDVVARIIATSYDRVKLHKKELKINEHNITYFNVDDGKHHIKLQSSNGKFTDMPIEDFKTYNDVKNFNIHDYSLLILESKNIYSVNNMCFKSISFQKIKYMPIFSIKGSYITNIISGIASRIHPVINSIAPVN